MKLDDKKEMINRYVQAYNQFDVEGMLATLSDNITFENVQNGEVNASSNGKAGFKELAEQAKSVFSERKQTIDGIESDSDIVSVNISYYGKLASDLPNGMKAGDEINMTGVSEFVFANNKICSIRDIS